MGCLYYHARTDAELQMETELLKCFKLLLNNRVSSRGQAHFFFSYMTNSHSTTNFLCYSGALEMSS
jgi:hypothetical protein